MWEITILNLSLKNKSKSHQNKDFGPDINLWGKKVIGNRKESKLQEKPAHTKAAI